MNTTDDPSPEDEPVTPQEQAAVASDQPGTPGRVGGMARVAAPVVAALLVGGGVVFAVDHNSGSNASASSASAFGGPAGLGARGGGVAGEQRIQGTVTAKTSTTVTVKSSSGTSTYAVNATTEIVRDGLAASLSSVQVGDPVLVHVYPSSSGRMLVERLLAGSSASGGPGGFGPPPASAGDGTQSRGSGT